jgi:hypothetical protein
MSQLSPAEEWRIARECVEAELPRWWRADHRQAFMRLVEEYALARARMMVQGPTPSPREEGG